MSTMEQQRARTRRSFTDELKRDAVRWWSMRATRSSRSRSGSGSVRLRVPLPTGEKGGPNVMFGVDRPDLLDEAGFVDLGVGRAGRDPGTPVVERVARHLRHPAPTGRPHRRWNPIESASIRPRAVQSLGSSQL